MSGQQPEREQLESINAEISRTVKFIEMYEICYEDVDDKFLRRETAQARRELVRLAKKRDQLREMIQQPERGEG